MFNPDQTKRLRTKTKETPEFSLFEDNNIGCQEITVGTLPEEENKLLVAGSLYGPRNIFGEPFDKRCLEGIGSWYVHAPQMIVAELRNARVIGSAAVLDGGNTLYDPDQISCKEQLERATIKNRNDYQGFVLEPTAEHSAKCYFLSRPAPRHIPGTMLFFHNPESANFGSFVFRQLPQMLLTRSIAHKVDYYVVTERTQWLFEVFKLLGFPAKPVFTAREVCGETFETVLLPNEFDAEGFLQTSTLSAVEELMASMPIDESAPEKIYVSRALTGVSRSWYRSMLNELEVEDFAKLQGFQVVYPEALSFEHQIRTFRNARAIVGPSGSGMFNALFTRDSCKILDIESFHNTVRQHAKFYASTKHIYSFLFAKMDEADGRHPIVRNYNVPIDLLRAGLGWLTDID